MAKRTEEERFWAKVDVGHPLGCWEWTAGKDWDGYGIFKRAGGVSARAHRWTYEHLRHAIPAGLHIDHLCRNTSCVNPDHLEAVTNRTNILRGYAPPAVNSRRDKCKNGHQFDADRKCPTCGVLNTRRHKGIALDAPIRPASGDRTHCPQGHPYDEENTYRPPGQPTKRMCRSCHRERERRRYHERKHREQSMGT